MRAARQLIALVALSATGCATLGTSATINTAIPVACREREPDRPAMPTEGLRPGVKSFVFVTAAQAEIEIREGYEGQLVAALRACIKPIAPAGSK